MRFLVSCFIVLASGCSINLAWQNLTARTLEEALRSAMVQCPSPEQLSLQNNLLNALPETTKYALLDTACVGTPFLVEEMVLGSCQDSCTNQSLCSYLTFNQSTCSLFAASNCKNTRNGPIYRKDVLLAGLDFPNLTLLDLSNNQLTALPLSVMGLSSLTSLNLEQNSIKVLPANSLSRLASLRTLNLKINNITDLSADAFGPSSSLGFLDLEANQLTSISASVFAGLYKLSALYLDSNPLVSLAQTAFSGLSELTDLRVSSNRLASLPAGIFSMLTKLDSVQLSYNLLTSIPHDLFQASTNLTAIQLMNTNLISLPHDLFHGLTKLTQLELQRNALPSLPADIFEDLTALEDLQMDAPPLCDGGANCAGAVKVGKSTRSFITSPESTVKSTPTTEKSFGLAPSANPPSITAIVGVAPSPITRVEMVSSNDTPSLGVIVGTVLGSLCALKIVLFVAYIYIKRKLKARKNAKMETTTPTHARTSSAVTTNISTGSSMGPDNTCGPYLGKERPFYADTPTHAPNTCKSEPDSVFSFIPTNPRMIRFYDDARGNAVPDPSLPVFVKGNFVYTAIQMLGKGHFGTAYLVIDPLKNLLVVKTITCKDQNEAVKEAKTLSLQTPRSPHLLTILDFFFETEQMFCIVVNYCQGGSVQDMVLQKVGLDEIERVLKEIAIGLDCLHTVGMIHRDLKPDNIFLQDRDSRTVVIGDMGMARSLNPDGYFDSSYGHILYKAPEIEEGKYSTRSDMWALGCIGFELLSGESLVARYASNQLVLTKATTQELANLLNELPTNCKQHASFKIVSGLLVREPHERLTASQVKDFQSSNPIESVLSPSSIQVMSPSSVVENDKVALLDEPVSPQAL